MAKKAKLKPSDIERVTADMIAAMRQAFPDSADLVAFMAASPAVKERMMVKIGRPDAELAELAAQDGMDDAVSERVEKWLFTQLTPGNIRSAIQGAKDLISLRGALLIAEQYIVAHDLPDSSCVFTDDDMQMSFGGKEPDLMMDGVWAWDETHILKWWGVWDLVERTDEDEDEEVA